MSFVNMKVGLVNGQELTFAPTYDSYAVDPARDIAMAIDKLDQGYKALRMWLVMQLPPQEQAKFSQEAQQPARCRCPKGGGYPAPEVRSGDLAKIKVPDGPAPGAPRAKP